MNWLSDITPPGIKKMFRHRETSGDTLWNRCPACAEMTFVKDLEAAMWVCPNCDHHQRMGPHDRLASIFDDGEWEQVELPDVNEDPLKFRDTRKYTDRLRDSRKKTGDKDALIIGRGKLDLMPLVAAAQDFGFMGGSMGMALGEGMIKAAETAIADRAPMVVFAASGGARMQEGILSLMQMPRSTIAVQMLRDEGLPYVVVLTNPTTGGVTASYAMLGDVHLAEPGALIGFAGPRVIEQTIREKLPEGFQRAEYLYEKGMVDQVVHRHAMRETLSSLLRVLTKFEPAVTAIPSPEPAAEDEEPATVEAEIVVEDDELPKAAE